MDVWRQLKKRLPWWAKIAGKIVLSRSRLPSSVLRRLGVFVHGSMQDPDYAWQVFKTHFIRCRLDDGQRGIVGLELGPGDSLLSAILVRAYGGEACYLVDTARFAIEDLAPYRSLAVRLARDGLTPPDFSAAQSLDDLLSVCNATYKCAGLASLRDIPSESVAFIWSHAVLEHIRRRDFLPTLKELRRVLRPGGIASHRIDLRDHLAGSLNHLRFSAAVWESEFMARSGFYTNRIRYSEMLNLFRAAGFEVNVVGTDRWERLPLPRSSLSPMFRTFSDDDLCVLGFDVILHPASR